MSGGGSKFARLGCDYVHKVEDIPDLVVKILSYLPVGSVLRCKLVCKSWYRLIKEPRFAQLQFNCSPKAPKFILSQSRADSELEARNNLSLMDIDGKSYPYVTLPPSLAKDCSLRLICSFNGLIFFTKLVGEDDLAIHICNPATQEVIEVPRGSPSAVIPSIGVLFEPNRNKYMIFRFFSDAFELEEISYKYEIYTPDDGDWGRISEVEQCPVTNLACHYFPTHLCVGGRMYWLVWSEQNGEVPDYIRCVDVDGDLTRLELPETDRTEFNVFTFLADYEGGLALVAVCDDESCLFFWSLTDHDTSSWSLHGGAELNMHSYIERINSIVSVGQELLFIINIDDAPFFCFKFLNANEMTWREIDCHLQPEESEPVAFQYEESLFRCEGECEDED
ncbi:hypothetical protein C2S53_000884 [Perilla frutescens var. hirtella]|uniref:F-box domain-containing protein n=1 Tax=Perilla frutescens var. hirtella TaxID=608512 RepID=A0AAD4JK52_PERFH|nr:hypothetical protein C2S53_000884 [Perilla frutescens var. hirtella]